MTVWTRISISSLRNSGTAPRSERPKNGSDYPTLMNDLLRGEYSEVLRVVAFNPSEGWSRDASEDIARELERRVASEGRELSGGLQDFIEGQLGRKIGVQLPLPLQI
jgi:hypothetical protein